MGSVQEWRRRMADWYSSDVVRKDASVSPRSITKTGIRLFMKKHLCDSAEFQHVYRNGKRYEGAFITVFVIDNKLQQHRLGVTASKKALGKAVQRNRAKRLLRETFRCNEVLLKCLHKNYDWVLNAKAAVLSDKLRAPSLEFGRIVEKVGRQETLG
jgi:ribonuclease P protein component